MDANMQFRQCPNCGSSVNVNLPSCWSCGMIFYQQPTQQTQPMYYQQPQYPQQIQPQYNFMQHPQQQQSNNQQRYNSQSRHKDSINSCLGLIIGAFVLLVLIGSILPALTKYIDENREKRNSTTEYVSNQEQSNTTTQESVTTTEATKVDVSIDEQIIYEGNDVIIKVTGIENNNVSFYFENNSSVNLGFNMHSYAVNGLMTNENIYTMDCNVAPNSKNTCTLEIPSEFLKNNNIDLIKTLTLHIWAYDNDAYYKEFECGSIHLSTSVDNNINNIQSGKLLLEENGLKYELIKTQGNVYYIGITNTNIELCEVDMQNLVINDWTCDIAYNFDLMSLQILPNCQNIIPLDLTEYLQEKNIDKIEYVSFNFDVRPNADYFNNYIGSTIRIE